MGKRSSVVASLAATRVHISTENAPMRATEGRGNIKDTTVLEDDYETHNPSQPKSFTGLAIFTSFRPSCAKEKVISNGMGNDPFVDFPI